MHHLYLSVARIGQDHLRLELFQLLKFIALLFRIDVSDKICYRNSHDDAACASGELAA